MRSFALVSAALMLLSVLVPCALADIPPRGRRIEVTARLSNLSDYPDYTFITRSASHFGTSYSEVHADVPLSGIPKAHRWNLLAVKTAVLKTKAHAELVAILQAGGQADRRGPELMKLTEGVSDFQVSEDVVHYGPEYTEDSSDDVQSIAREYRIAGFEGAKLRVYLARETKTRPGGEAETKEFPNPLKSGPVSPVK